MAELILVQDQKDISSMVDRLMKMNKTNLTKVCEKGKRDYTTTYRKLNNEKVDIKFIEKLVREIDKTASFEVEFCVSLRKDDKLIFLTK